MKWRNKKVQEITRNVANVFNFYAVIAIEHGFSMHLHSPGPMEGVENRGLRHGTWRMLMHEKQCLIPTITHSCRVDSYPNSLDLSISNRRGDG